VEDVSRERDLRDRLQWVRERIERAACLAGRNPADIRLIAVTKTVPVDRMLDAAASGCRTFGENRIQEALSKMEQVEVPGCEWHFLGPLQSNKIKSVVGRFAVLHAIDRVSVAEHLDRAMKGRGMRQRVLLQVKVSEEPSKHGFHPDRLGEAAVEVAKFENLHITGLMTIAPMGISSEECRPYFRHLRTLAERLDGEAIPGVVMKELSMGMSADFECAIEEGATMVRIGRALFGSRPQFEKKSP
jgi:pyridoxal phosphate enzyme (YggS family)